MQRPQANATAVGKFIPAQRTSMMKSRTPREKTSMAGVCTPSATTSGATNPGLPSGPAGPGVRHEAVGRVARAGPQTVQGGAAAV